MLSGFLHLAFLRFDLWIGITALSFGFAVLALWVLARRMREGRSLARAREEARERGLDPLALSLLESVAAQAASRAEEILRSEERFDESAQRHLLALADSGVDPRETAKELVLLKRELKLEEPRPAPTLLARVILGEAGGNGAAEGRLVAIGPEEYEIAIGVAFQGLRRGAIVELVFADGEKMAGLAAVVRELDEKRSFCLVRIASPEKGGFRKREHFRIDTKIPATVLIQSDQVAYMPDEGAADFRVLSAELVNLSGGGGRLRLGFAVNPGDRLCLSFVLGTDLKSVSKPMGVEGKVVWAKREEGDSVWSAGFEFEGMNSETLRRLLLYLFARKSEQVNRGKRGTSLTF